MSNREEKTKRNLDRRIESLEMSEQVVQTLVPLHKITEIKDGKRRQIEKKLLPGYIMVRMVITEESVACVRWADGVLGFAGGAGAAPTPLPVEEVNRILKVQGADAPKMQVDYVAGQKVRIISGPFAESYGTVKELMGDRGKVIVMITMFGRETPLEVDMLEIRPQE